MNDPSFADRRKELGRKSFLAPNTGALRVQMLQYVQWLKGSECFRCQGTKAFWTFYLETVKPSFPKAPLHPSARSKAREGKRMMQRCCWETGSGLFRWMGFIQTPKTLKPLLHKSDHPCSLRSEKSCGMWSDIHRLHSWNIRWRRQIWSLVCKWRKSVSCSFLQRVGF